MKLTPRSTAVPLAASVVLAAMATFGASAEPMSRSEDKGLESRVVAAGHCDDGARYRLVLRNEELRRGTFVTGTMTIRDAQPRSRWVISTLASTTFADGSQVTGTTDAVGRADKRGRLRIKALTRAGARHELEFLARGGVDLCFVNLRA